MSSGKLKDKVAVIIGAATGLGRETAGLFVAEGASLVIADANKIDGQKTAHELNVEFAQVDVSDSLAVKQLIDSVVARFGRLDILVNVAGIFRNGPLTQTSDADYRKIMSINLDGIFYSTREAARVMIPHGKGSIVNVASVGGSFTSSDMSAYCASKAGVIGLTKSAAVELAPKGLRVNSVSPGTMLTGMGGIELTDAVVAALNSLQPRPTAAHPAEVAQAILFLASDDASFVIGQDLQVDGGTTAGRIGTAPK